MTTLHCVFIGTWSVFSDKTSKIILLSFTGPATKAKTLKLKPLQDPDKLALCKIYQTLLLSSFFVFVLSWFCLFSFTFCTIIPTAVPIAHQTWTRHSRLTPFLHIFARRRMCWLLLGCCCCCSFWRPVVLSALARLGGILLRFLVARSAFLFRRRVVVWGFVFPAVWLHFVLPGLRVRVFAVPVLRPSLPPVRGWTATVGSVLVPATTTWSVRHRGLPGLVPPTGAAGPVVLGSFVLPNSNVFGRSGTFRDEISSQSPGAWFLEARLDKSWITPKFSCQFVCWIWDGFSTKTPALQSWKPDERRWLFFV